MSTTPKTIQIFLPGGDPRGIRTAEITTRIVQVIEVPRSLLDDFLKMPESTQVALYFLFGDAEDGTGQKVYIGQSSDLRTRMPTHNQNKGFWQRAIILISRTQTLTQTHALFLEWHSLQQANKAERYTVENGNGGSKPYTPPPLEADCMEIFETGSTLLATLGYPVFDPVAKTGAASSANEVFLCTASGANGRGLYTQEGFVVLKGSVGRKDIVPSMKDTSYEVTRNELVTSGVMRIENDTVIFNKDHLFNSPSAAAFAVTGTTANGWITWKTKDGKTLDAVKRQAPVQ